MTPLCRIVGWYLAGCLLFAVGCAPATLSPAGAFGPRTNLKPGGHPVALAVADLNGGGRLDLVVAHARLVEEIYWVNTISVLLGTGDGAFGPVIDVATVRSPGAIALAVADLNRDGKLDLVYAIEDRGNISVLLGFGDGTFARTNSPATGPIYRIALGDLNGDGILDLVMATQTDTVAVLLGTGDRTFGPMTNVAWGDYPHALALADLNSDGKLDLVVANAGANSVSVLLGNGDGTFAPKVDFDTGRIPSAIALVDLDRDGKLDLVVTNRGEDSVSVLKGKGDGTFAVKTDFATGASPHGLALADLNRDGRLDLVVANTFANSVSVLLGNGDGTFGPKTDVQTDGVPLSLALGDLYRDGKVDLVVGNWVASSLSIFRNVAPRLTVTTTGSGKGTLTSSPTGINCGPTCTAEFNAGTRVTLRATSVAASVFVGWGEECTGVDACTVTMTNNAHSVTARFDAPVGSRPGSPSQQASQSR